MKCDENFINLKKDEPLRANAVNLVIFTNALCHFNATPLSVVVLAPCAWGENLACGVAWQGVLLGRNSVCQGALNSAKRNTANSAWQVFAGEAGKAKMGQCLGGGLLSLSLSLSLLALLARFWAKFKGLFYLFCRSFISFYCRFYSFHRNFISFNRKFFLFHRSFISYFCLQKAFFRALCFFKIFKCFIFGFLRPFCHFEPFAKRRKISNICHKNLVILSVAKNPHFKSAICTLNLWILRYAQYDKV